MLRIPAAPSQIPSSGSWPAVASLRYRIEAVGKDLGTLSQTLLRKLLSRSFLRTFKNFKQGDFCSLLFVCADFGAAIFRATISGCSETNPVKRYWHGCRLSPLPGRNGRKLHLNRAEQPMCRSVAGECNLLTTIQSPTRVPRFRLLAPLRGSTPRHFIILSLDC